MTPVAPARAHPCGDVVVDLAAEQDALEELVSERAPSDWSRVTPSPGWSVADQIAHLAYFDRAAAVAIEDPTAFAREAAELVEAAGRDELDDVTLGSLRSRGPAEVLGAWRSGRARLARAVTTLGAADRVPWYGPAMGARSFLSARLMETWAHGTDVAAALGVSLTATDRLHHVARLGLATRNWSYRVRAEEVPTGAVRLELTAPSGVLWRLGPETAHDVVRGPGEDFCLVVTQRRHLDDTELRTGSLGRDWLLRAQAFAGRASLGPPARGRRGPR